MAENEETTAVAEEATKAAFDAAMEGIPDGTEARTSPESPEPEEEEESPEEETAEEHAEAEPKEEPSSEDASERKGIASLDAKQVSALARAKHISKELLDGLSDAQLASLADGLAAERADRDRDYGKLQQTIAAEAKPTEGKEGEPARSPSPDPEPVDVSAFADPLAKTLGLDDPEAKHVEDALRGVAKAAAESAVKALSGEVKAARDLAESAVAQEAKREVFAAIDELKEEFPTLVDPAIQAKVIEQAKGIQGGFDFSKPGETRRCLEWAAAMAEVPRAEPKAEVEERGPSPRDKATPQKGGRKPKPKPKTQEQKRKAVFEEAMKANGQWQDR